MAIGAGLFVFRSAETPTGGAGDSPEPPRERTIVAFGSADSALAFAQRNGLGPHPRFTAPGDRPTAGPDAGAPEHWHSLDRRRRGRPGTRNTADRLAARTWYTRGLVG
ncbi:hypothetical protein HC891_27350 [Candidatus Gracilibacteria bacterium]|nr:hypothetical protein [Candidatus Gracilibacteria bacterium]